MLAVFLSLALSAGIPLPAEATNTFCPVTGFPVPHRLIYKTVEVQGRNYRVFDRRSGILLKNWPAGYLGKDGTPLNARLAFVPSGEM